MSKIDPITGCEVMTHAEFLQAEADREGHGDPSKIMDDIDASLVEDDRLMEKHMSNLEDAFKVILNYSKENVEEWESDKKYAAEMAKDEEGKPYVDFHRWDSASKKYIVHRKPFKVSARPLVPCKIVEVNSAKHHGSFSGAKGKIEGRALCDDGKIHTFRFSFDSYYGNYLNPPDSDEQLEWDI